MKIYKSGLHLAAAFLLLLLPFLFLLFFAKIEQIATAKLFSDVLSSLARLFVAYIISISIAWLLAVAFYHGRRANFALPIFDIMQSFPIFSVVPLAIIYWGQTNFTVIFFLAAGILWAMIFPIISALKLIRHDWIEVMQIYNLSGTNYFKNFLWPISLPGLITASIIGLGQGWQALVATEIIVNIPRGLGSFFSAYADNARITAFGIFGLLIIVFAVNKLIWSPLLEVTHRMMEE